MCFHKEGFEQRNCHRGLKYCFLYCKGFPGDCNDCLQNWVSGVKNDELHRLRGCNFMWI